MVLSALISFGSRRDMDSCLFSSFITGSLPEGVLLEVVVFSSSFICVVVWGGGEGGAFSWIKIDIRKNSAVIMFGTFT